MSDEKKKDKPEASESVSKVILNIHDRVDGLDQTVSQMALAMRKFTDAVTEYLARNDRNVDKLMYWSIFHLIVEGVLVWAVFFK